MNAKKVALVLILLFVSGHSFGAANQSEPSSNMPWIVALVIGVLSAVINFLISWQMRVSNHNILEKQIESTQKIKMKEFHSSIVSQNQQEWLNEIRNSLSDFLSNSTLIVQTTHPGLDLKHSELRQKYIESLLFSKSKLELLLNPSYTEEKELLEKINTLHDINANEPPNYVLAKQNARQEILKTSRTFFKSHWERIKKLELK